MPSKRARSSGIRRSPKDVLKRFIVSGPDESGEYKAHCPLHEDEKPSASLNFDADTYFCFAGCGGGSIGDLAWRVLLQDEATKSAPHMPKVRPPLPSENRIHGWHERLIDSGAMSYLARDREISEEIIKRYEIGWHEGKSAYTMPIRDRRGQLRNVRYYQRSPDGKRIWSSPKRRARLYPIDILAGNDEILIVEGEWDALCAISHGLPAITGTGGAAFWNPAWSKRFAGKRVTIVYDSDSAGRKNARRVAESLAQYASSVAVLDLDPGRSDGFDISDWFAEDKGITRLRQLIESASPRPLLDIKTVGEIAQRIDMQPPAQWLFRPVMTSDAYGVLAAEDKAGKSWAMTDAAVSVASGTPWLDHFPVDEPGPVLLFAGEGGERKLVRRMRAICEPRGLDLDKLPVRVALRVPNLGSAEHMELVRRELAAYPARLVLIDPLYLALGKDARSSDLFNMGSYLQELQHAAQAAGAALLIAHHWNQTGKGNGPNRMSGAGASAWGRVLISGNVESQRTETDGKTVVHVTWEFRGDEVPTASVRMIRRVWADDPDDVASPLHYELEAWDLDAPARDRLSPVQRRVLNAVRGVEHPRTVRKIHKVIETSDAKDVPTKRTVEKYLTTLRRMGLVGSKKDENGVNVWWRKGE